MMNMHTAQPFPSLRQQEMELPAKLWVPRAERRGFA